MQRGRFGGIVYEPTLRNFTRALDPIFVNVLLDSLVIAGITTVLALLLGYPTAYVIASLPREWRTVALVAVVLPFWTNFLIRTYAWIVLLNSEGPVNQTLTGSGLVDDPLTLLYTKPAVVAGLLYAYLPLMILPLYSSIERLDPQLREAATNLGASPLRAFRDVTLPLTLPGRAHRLHLRLRAEPRELRHPRAARRRQDGDGGQPDPRPVPEGARLAVRLGARAVGDRLPGRRCSSSRHG